ncbi:carboxymuconolactone decarboxylase [Mycobacterium colombiense]|nr:carboxymuconolactone decarboxylase [Mycobacterium colombiense]
MRLSPLPAEQWDDRVRDSLSALVPRDRRTPAGAGTAMSTLVRHPDLTKAFLHLGIHVMLGSTLSSRAKEIVTLSVAARRNCAYIWLHHLGPGRAAGLDDIEIDGIRHGVLPDPFEQALLDTVVELEDGSWVTHETWATLRQALDELQCMDLVFMVGYFGMLAMAYNSFGVQPDITSDVTNEPT